MRSPIRRVAQVTAAILVLAAAPPVTALATDFIPAGLVAPEQAAAEGDGAAPVLVGAGNIATCGEPRHEATAQLVDRVVAGSDATVFVLGDNAYERGSLREYRECYHPTWGRHRERTRPALGNWEYATPGAAGYFEYFGARAGDPDRGYYSYELGGWHILVLNTDCRHAGGCGSESPQGRWLRAELEMRGQQCTLAYGHHPRFSSSREVPSHPEMETFWTMLEEAGTVAYIAGHSHHYERFAPQTGVGVASDTGIRQFVVGTGGREGHAVGNPLPNSEVIAENTYGVLKLTLHPGRLTWEFLSTPDSTFTDTGEATCTPGRGSELGTIARSTAPFLIAILPIVLLLIPILFRPPRYRVN